MNRDAKSILDAALSLPPEERAEIAERLMLSLDDQYYEEIEKAWDAELQRRVREVDSGEVLLIPADEAMRSILERRRP